MRERGLLMTAPNVRSILAETKTQTRRIVKLQPPSVVHSVYRPLPAEPNNWQGYGFGAIHWYGRCPYGVVGDRLWVRETWQYDRHAIGAKRDEDGTFVYAATDNPQHRMHGKWRPSIFMPRYASRIMLEITDVRVERLQEISEADCVAEGIVAHRKGGWWWEQPPPGIEGTNHFGAKTARDAYRVLWKSINGPGSWGMNPWVWVISFRRVT